MYNFLSLLIGFLIAVMVYFNGQLSGNIGNYSALVIIHIIGLVSISAIMLIKKVKISFKNNLPLYLYSAGAITTFTVLINNITYSEIGVALPVALGLLGQSITSIIFDEFGLLGMPKVKFNNKKLIGLAIIIAGICIMTFL